MAHSGLNSSPLPFYANTSDACHLIFNDNSYSVTHLAAAGSELFTGLPNHTWEKGACCTILLRSGARRLTCPALPFASAPTADDRLISPHVHRANQHRSGLSRSSDN